MAFKMKGSQFYGHGNSSPLKDYTEITSKGPNSQGDEVYTWSRVKEDHEASKPRKAKTTAYRTNKAKMDATLYDYHTHDVKDPKAHTYPEYNPQGKKTPGYQPK